MLPTIAKISRTVLPGYWCADNDYGKMFLNFPLHGELQTFCGVDLLQIFDETMNGKKDQPWEYG
jgi:hypothetical protein